MTRPSQRARLVSSAKIWYDSPRKLVDRNRFEEGLEKLIVVRHPQTILVFGSAKYPCFDRLGEQGISVIAYPSNMASAFEKRRRAG